MRIDVFKIALVGIFILSIILRFVFIDVSPPSLNWDEASLGYNAYSILKTGRDEWGRFLPLTFEAFGDYKLPVYIYSAVPFIALFGLEEWVIKLPSQIAGVLAPLFLYLIIVLLTKKKSLGLAVSFLLTISPWHVFLSRIALEANLAFTLFLAGFYTFLLGLKRPYFLVLSSILFGLTLYTYNSARIFTPLFIISLIFFYWRQLRSFKRHLILASGLLFVFVIVAGYLAVFQDSSSRYYWVTIVDQGAINYLNESRAASPFPDLLTKLIYNKYSYFIFVFVKNYLSHFSVEYLFLKGGSNHQFSIPDFGLLYIFEFPLLAIGIFQALKKKTITSLILVWLLIAPIPSAITREAPHVLRSIFMLGALQIYSGYGLLEVIQFTKRYRKEVTFSLLTTLAILILINSAVFIYQYFVTYPKWNSQSWQYSMKQVMETLSENPDQTVYFTKFLGEPHIYYLFYTKYDPAKYQTNPTLIRYAQTNWRWVDRIDNVHFINDWEMMTKLKDVTHALREENAIVIARNDTYPKNATILKRFYFLDGNLSLDVIKL